MTFNGTSVQPNEIGAASDGERSGFAGRLTGGTDPKNGSLTSAPNLKVV